MPPRPPPTPTSGSRSVNLGGARRRSGATRRGCGSIRPWLPPTTTMAIFRTTWVGARRRSAASARRFVPIRTTSALITISETCCATSGEWKRRSAATARRCGSIRPRLSPTTTMAIFRTTWVGGGGGAQLPRGAAPRSELRWRAQQSRKPAARSRSARGGGAEPQARRCGSIRPRLSPTTTMVFSWSTWVERDEAERSYREALRPYPNYVHAHNGLGNLLGDLGRWKKQSGATARRFVSIRTTPTPTRPRQRAAQSGAPRGGGTQPPRGAPSRSELCQRPPNGLGNVLLDLGRARGGGRQLPRGASSRHKLRRSKQQSGLGT